MDAIATGANKYASEYPLPGGVERYFDTLVALLRHIRDNNVTPDGLTQWVFDTFPNASGQIAVNGYIATVSRLGLWAQQDDLVRLTPEGTSLVTKVDSAPDEARRMLLDIKYRDILGYDVLFELLGRGPQTLDVIHQHLNEALGVDWKSRNQSSFRVSWLRSLGYVEKEDKEYKLTAAGNAFLQQVGQGSKIGPSPIPKPVKPEPDLTPPLVKEAIRIADWLDSAAVAGGDGKEFEEATEVAFQFLGFETRWIGGSGNPDVLATAAMGEKSYRVIIDSKSRSAGVVQVGDVNLPVIEKHKQSVSADHAVVVGADFAGGDLETFAVQRQVRLLATSEIRELLLAHAQSIFPLDVLRPLFQGGGATDEGVLSEILTSAESKAGVLRLAREVFAAVRASQDKEAVVHADSLYFILKGEHSLSNIKLAVAFLKSDLIGALGETEQRGEQGRSLYTRISPATLANKLSQITRVMDLRREPDA